MNKKTIVVCGLIAALSGSMGYSLHANGQQSREPHPEIRAAMKSLNGAAGDLKRAARDYGGHRAKALELTNNALSECREALKFDK